MTTLRSPSFPDLTSTSINLLSCRPGEPVRLPSNMHNYNSASINASINASIVGGTRSISSVSSFSLASAPVIENNENTSPTRAQANSTLRSASTREVNTFSRAQIYSPALQTNDGPLNSSKLGTTKYDPLKDMKHISRVDCMGDGAPPSMDKNTDVYYSTPMRTPPRGSQIATPSPVLRSAIDPDSGSTISTALTRETALTSRLCETQGIGDKSDCAQFRSLTTTPSVFHHQRLSDGSSGFVHTVKTASMTNASMSIVSHLHPFGHSHDSRSVISSYARFSVDSDRPVTSSSFDDLAISRAAKRFSVIDELISTEQTYVSDLKALSYLYSTLLASTSTISEKVRTAVQHNVTDLLRTHEKLLDRFRSAALNAAARRWEDTAILSDMSCLRTTHSRAPDRLLGRGPCRSHRCVMSPVDYSNAHIQTPLSIAEPVDVSEVITELKKGIIGFFAYEEYCANHEIISSELQRCSPDDWPTYEAGMESLARAIATIDSRSISEKKAFTVSDLLIKPIQRICKYPLLLEELIAATPVADDPATHAELEVALQQLKDVVTNVNLATSNHHTRSKIQKRWLLYGRLNLKALDVSSEQFRLLGVIELCGVLYVTTQTSSATEGTYALCALFDNHFLIATPGEYSGNFEARMLIRLSDLKVEASNDGKGLQCSSTLYTWKVTFTCSGIYHTIILSACSKSEEDQWINGLRGEFCDKIRASTLYQPFPTICAINLRSLGAAFPSQQSLSRESSMQRAATVGSNRASISHVIVRNTHNASDLQEYRESSGLSGSINRSQSHLCTKRIPVLEPKRSERVRMEQSIADIWTRDRLPFPGMIGSRGGQIIRASAGSLVRKLSLASIHTPFSRVRTSSLSTASRKSYDLFSDTKSICETKKRSTDHFTQTRTLPRDIPEVDDMRTVVGRMIGGTYSMPKEEQTSKLRDRPTKDRGGRRMKPRDPASFFNDDSEASEASLVDNPMLHFAKQDLSIVQQNKEQNAAPRKKRWSNPIAKLKRGFQEGRIYAQNK